jgi:hypothetical protein
MGELNMPVKIHTKVEFSVLIPEAEIEKAFDRFSKSYKSKTGEEPSPREAFKAAFIVLNRALAKAGMGMEPNESSTRARKRSPKLEEPGQR